MIFKNDEKVIIFDENKDEYLGIIKGYYYDSLRDSDYYIIESIDKIWNLKRYPYSNYIVPSSFVKIYKENKDE